MAPTAVHTYHWRATEKSFSKDGGCLRCLRCLLSPGYIFIDSAHNANEPHTFETTPRIRPNAQISLLILTSNAQYVWSQLLDVFEYLRLPPKKMVISSKNFLSQNYSRISVTRPSWDSKLWTERDVQVKIIFRITPCKVLWMRRYQLDVQTSGTYNWETYSWDSTALTFLQSIVVDYYIFWFFN